MVTLLLAFTVSKDDFFLFKNFPVIPRLATGIVFGVLGLLFQILLPINGIFPFETTAVSYVSFILGLVLIIVALLLLFPRQLKIAEKPKLSEEKGIWTDTTMKQLSDYFNLINTRKKNQKKYAAFFDLTKPKGRWTFAGTLFGVTLIYILSIALSSRFYLSTMLFLVDIYILLVPLWFVIRIECWEPEILRKILFYYQFTKHEELDELEFTTTPAIQLQQIIDPDLKDEIMLPYNVRFMIDFDEPPKSFDSLSIQILMNESMGSLFPSMVCFLRIRKPSDWKPLKKEIAYADRIVKIQHLVEEDDLHLFVLSKSPKVEDPKHTSPKDATKIFKRSYKMMVDFDAIQFSE